MLRHRPAQHHQISIEQPASLSQGSAFFNSDNDNGNGGGGGGLRYQLASGTDIYDASAPLANRGGGGMSIAGQGCFTASQRKELGRQMAICKYMMASVPVPSQLLFNSSTTQYPLSLSTYTELKFSNGSGPEPWRCKRTDGKKWRCSRNAAPDLKYCERHAHKIKSRSRKHVEIQPPNPPINYSRPPLSNGAKIHQSPTMGSSAPYLQSRGMEYLTNSSGSTAAVSTDNQQWKQLMQSSSNRHGTLTLLPYLENASHERLQNHQLERQYFNTVVDPEMGFSQGGLNAYTTQETRPLIDAWSTVKRGGFSEVSTEVPFCSLPISTPGGDEIDEDIENRVTSFGLMMNSERDSEDVMKSQWVNPITWKETTPGGPLGEALCLGLSNSEKGYSSLVSPHCYSNNTKTSICSGSSCVDSSLAFNFFA